MKKTMLVFAFAILLQLSFLSAQNLKMMPTHPQSGATITLNYDPVGTELEGTDVYAVAYVLDFEAERPIAYDVPMAKSDNGYTASFQSPANAEVVYFNFENETREKSDNNQGAGYYTQIYQGEKPVKNAYAMTASIYGKNAYFLNSKADGVKAAEMLALEMKNPADNLKMDYIGYYVNTVLMNKDETGKTKIVEHLKSSLANDKLTEKDLTELASIARSLKDRELFDGYNEKIKTQFPKGMKAVTEKYATFRRLNTMDEKITMYQEAKAAYGTDADHKMMIGNMARVIATDYGKQGDVEKMYTFAKELSNKNDQASIYNDVAWGYSGESLEGEGRLEKEGAEMSLKSLQLTEAEMKEQKEKPEFFSARQYSQNLKNTFAMYSDTYALVAYKTGDVKTALKYQKIACETSKMRDAGMNARYAAFMEEAEGSKATMTFLEEMIATGKADAKMKEQFTRLFKANMSVEQASQMYLAALEDKAMAHKIEEIKKELISKKAPDFALKNLQGEEVSLESLEGKVVVVDFWATWCGPCIQSFPGMQKAVNKYQASDDVAFVFIDTWESGKTKEKNAQKFLTEKGYTFNVLMDNDNKIVADYGVEGIPTKFILDKTGTIRFESTGFNGNVEALIDEISIVVEMLRGDMGAAGNTGAQP